MPRTRSNQPAYQYHISGQAKVRLGYTDFYLGKHGTPESYARYYALLAEYNANGKQAPEKVSPGNLEDETRLAETAILVKHVIADFRHRELPRHSGGHHNRFDNLLKLLDEKHGDDEADSFGPRRLEALRDGFLKKGNCRKYANMKTRFVVRIIKHGVARELVSPDRIVALEALPPLRKGQAKDNPKRAAANLNDVKATLPHLCETVVAMVRIQIAKAMRPSELFKMTPGMIDRSGDVWFYRPVEHKTADHGVVKAVPILGDALEALTPFLFGDAHEICFQTHLGTPWDKDSYRRHITRACEDNGITRWTPYMLRHTAAQQVRDEAGAEAAQALLGHSRLSTTEVYAKASEAKAIAAAQVAPTLG